MTPILLQIPLTCLVACFVVYVALEIRSKRRAGRDTAISLSGLDSPPPALPDFLPAVSVLLPVYNERLVVKKLLKAICALQYPLDKLDILVLDDSCDETTECIADEIAGHQRRGIPIRHARRETRIGYKAGNLNFGLTLARGDFIAVFDADCLPPQDFLLKTMPCFADEQLGFLQTAVVHANADRSFLTHFQATEAGHKEDVTTGLSRDGFMASLTGSSCVWRRKCIEAVGGISADTITEDVDMGYRAQLRAWKYLFLREVFSRAELPESMGAFRVQRQRWARGLVHNAVRHARGMFAESMPLLSRLYAVSLMFSPLLLAAFYALLLLSLPLAFLTAELGLFFQLCCGVFLLAAIAWAWCSTTVGEISAPCGAALAPWRHAAQALGYVLLFFPLSLYYFSAVAQFFSGIRTGFHRTPKGCGRKKIVHPPVNALLVYLEIFSLLYALTGLYVSLSSGNYWVTLFCALATGGFGMALFFSWSDHTRAMLPGHILITGASGALGGALAREYAAPGIKLTLCGRRAEALADIAARCRDKGADVETQTLDLRDTRELRRTIADLCRENPPDLVIANAGRNTNIGPRGEAEKFEEVQALVEVNILSVMALMDAVLPAMRKRGGGQIAITSSLASWYGLAVTPAYCASKAALRVYGGSLRSWLQKEGIRVNVILPGYVASPMCDAMPGPKPFLLRPEKAARIIRRGLKHDLARISFPFPLNLGVWGLSLLPSCLALPIARLLGYGR